MAKIKNKDHTDGLQLKSIEILNETLNLPSVPDVSLHNFSFKVGITHKADTDNKLLFVIVSVEIRNEDQIHLLGSLAVSCIYSVTGFDDVVRVKADGNLDLPQLLVEKMNTLSISTTRGIMFSAFKGTFLHNAFLPLIDPHSFQQIN